MKKLLFLFCLFQLINLSAQQTEYVDFKRIEAGIEFVLDSSLVKGKYSVDLLIMKKVDTIFIDAKNILRLNNPWYFPYHESFDLFSLDKPKLFMNYERLCI